MICCNQTMKLNGKDGDVQRYRCTMCGVEIREEVKPVIENVLCISDLHSPFIHPKALRFVTDVRDRFNCNKVVFLGDINDCYSFSTYAKDPDAANGRQETIEAKAKLKEWISEFPDAYICIGNHDARINKRISESGLPKSFLKTYNEIYDIPETWRWNFEWNFNGVKYIHGIRSGLFAHVNTAKDLRRSICMGHVHATAGVEYLQGLDDCIFAMCCGSLIDMESYAFAYAGNTTRKSIISCGVVLNNGKLPIVLPLEDK